MAAMVSWFRSNFVQTAFLEIERNQLVCCARLAKAIRSAPCAMMIHHSVPEKSNQATAKLLHVALVDSWFTLKAPRQGKHWNLDHPIYKKYRPAAVWLHLIQCQWMLSLLSDVLSFYKQSQWGDVMHCWQLSGHALLGRWFGAKMADRLQHLSYPQVIGPLAWTVWLVHQHDICTILRCQGLQQLSIFEDKARESVRNKFSLIRGSRTFPYFSYTFFASVEQAHKIKATTDFCDESLVYVL